MSQTHIVLGIAFDSKVYKALKPSGLFILDVFTEKRFAISKENKTSWRLYKNGGFWNAEAHICLEATYLYENNMVAVNQYIVILVEMSRGAN
jgi:hypothetical protein